MSQQNAERGPGGKKLSCLRTWHRSSSPYGILAEACLVAIEQTCQPSWTLACACQFHITNLAYNSQGWAKPNCHRLLYLYEGASSAAGMRTWRETTSETENQLNEGPSRFLFYGGTAPCVRRVVSFLFETRCWALEITPGWTCRGGGPRNWLPFFIFIFFDMLERSAFSLQGSQPRFVSTVHGKRE